MQPYGYQVPKQRKLGWGALGDDLSDAGVVYSPPAGWSVAVPFQVVAPSNQQNFTSGSAWSSGDVEQYDNPPQCPVYSMAVPAPVSGTDIPMFMPPLGWLVGAISNGVTESIIWIDPTSKVAYNLSDCSSSSTQEYEGGEQPPEPGSPLPAPVEAGFSLTGVLVLAGIVAGGWMLMRYWPKGKKTTRRSRRARRPARRRR